MSLSRKSPRQQPDSVPQGNQSHGTGADPQPATPAPTPALAVPRCPRGRPMPTTVNLLIEDLAARRAPPAGAGTRQTRTLVPPRPGRTVPVSAPTAATGTAGMSNRPATCSTGS